jgi:hypothetical protein
MVARPANPPGQPLTAPGWRAAGAAALAATLTVVPAVARADSTRFCDEPAPLTAVQHDRLLRFAGTIRAALEDSGQSVALVSRSGLALGRFGQRYSHAGLSLRDSEQTPWAVRQLYFACDERRPRLFDQGLAAFVQGMDRPELGFVSVVLMPRERAAELEAIALNNRAALALLAADYSANSYAFSPRYQNCNQWVAELMATAWSGADWSALEPAAWRLGAQDWMRTAGYTPAVFNVGSRLLMWLSTFSPWLHSDDHPPQDIGQAIYRVSMPSSVEAFVRKLAPAAQRLEFCHTDQHIVVRRGWQPLTDACEPGPQDTLIPLD